MNKALILDRDGVINKEINYLYKIEDVEFIDGIFETCKYFMDRDHLIIVVTNQAGIARGYYSEEDFLKLSDWMVTEFKKHQVEISKIFYCPFHPSEGIGKDKKDSFDRKPNPGMILKARDEFNLDLKSCILVGDKISDIEAGINAGVGTNVLLRSCYKANDSTKADLVIDSIKVLTNVLSLK